MNQKFIQSITLAILCAGSAAASNANAPAGNIRPPAQAAQTAASSNTAPGTLADGIALPGLFEKMMRLIGRPPTPPPARPAGSQTA